MPAIEPGQPWPETPEMDALSALRVPPPAVCGWFSYDVRGRLFTCALPKGHAGPHRAQAQYTGDLV